MTLEERISQIEGAIVKVGRAVLPIANTLLRFVPKGFGSVMQEVEDVIAGIEKSALTIAKGEPAGTPPPSA